MSYLEDITRLAAAPAVAQVCPEGFFLDIAQVVVIEPDQRVSSVHVYLWNESDLFGPFREA